MNWSIRTCFAARKADGTEYTPSVVSGTVSIGGANGDVDGDGEITESDAIFLLYHIFFPEEYACSQNADVNKDGEINEDDAIYLLYYCFFPDEYPL